ILQQPELARLQRQLVLAARDAVRKTIELEITDPIGGFLGRAAMASRQYFDPREQLGEGIGFWQIVVPAGAQALDAIVDLSERRQDQRRRAVALLAQRTDQR